MVVATIKFFLKISSSVTQSGQEYLSHKQEVGGSKPLRAIIHLFSFYLAIKCKRCRQKKNKTFRKSFRSKIKLLEKVLDQKQNF